MFNKKKALANILFRTHLINFFKNRASKRFIIINYHRIWPDGERYEMPFDDGVFGINQKQFYHQLVWIKKNFRIISEKELMHFLRQNEANGGPYAMITFDDSYRDFFDLAFPVLEKLCIPSLLFVPVEIINSRKVGWWDLIAYYIKKTNKTYFCYQDKNFVLKDNREKTIRFFHEKMKVSNHDETRRIPEELSALLDVSPPSVDLQDEQLMNWEQIRFVSEHNVSIGSHTLTHHVLATLTPNEQREELIKSKASIEQHINREIYSIAYPVGGKKHYDNITLQLAKNAGYQMGFSFNTGVNDWKNVNPMEIARSGVANSIIVNYCMCFLPEIFFGDLNANTIKKAIKQQCLYLIKRAVNVTRHVFFAADISKLTEIEPLIPVRYRFGTYSDIEKMNFEHLDYDDKGKRYARQRLNAGDKVVLGEYAGRVVFYCWICFGKVELGYNKFVPCANDLAFEYKGYVAKDMRGKLIYPAFHKYIKNFLIQKGFRKLMAQASINNNSSQKSIPRCGFQYIDKFYIISAFGLTSYLLSKKIKEYIR